MTTILGTPQVSQTLLEDLDRVGRKYDRWTPEAYFELDGSFSSKYCRGNIGDPADADDEPPAIGVAVAYSAA